MKVCFIAFLFMFFLSLGAEDQAHAKAESSEKQVQNIENNREQLSNEQGYDIKLKNIEERINSLKDKIFRSKERLAVLQESILSGVVAGTGVSIVHKNAIDSLFRLISAVFYLDDRQIFSKNDSADEFEMPEIKVYEGTVEPGTHNISVFYVFEGKRYGLFSYLSEYTFKINADYTFSVEEGNTVEVVVSPEDKGGKYNFNNRLHVIFGASKKPFEVPEGG